MMKLINIDIEIDRYVTQDLLQSSKISKENVNNKLCFVSSQIHIIYLNSY